MKTWEVYKALLENPKKKFRGKKQRGNPARDGIYGLDEKGCLCSIRSKDVYGYVQPRANEEWEEVGEPVPWQEAIQAWIDGETICVECYDSDESPIEMDIDATGDGFYLMKHMLTKGGWYIK